MAFRLAVENRLRNVKWRWTRGAEYTSMAPDEWVPYPDSECPARPSGSPRPPGSPPSTHIRGQAVVIPGVRGSEWAMAFVKGFGVMRWRLWARRPRLQVERAGTRHLPCHQNENNHPDPQQQGGVGRWNCVRRRPACRAGGRGIRHLPCHQNETSIQTRISTARRGGARPGRRSGWGEGSDEDAHHPNPLRPVGCRGGIGCVYGYPSRPSAPLPPPSG